MSKEMPIRTGVGGWVFDEWRANFYPSDLPKTRELEYASRKLRVIEINATFYGPQKPASFAKWREQTPEDFCFTVKAPRLATQRSHLQEGLDSARRFIGGGLSELGNKLGPVLWQFAPHKRFDPDELAAFLDGLPRELDGKPLRHALDARHESFMCEAFVTLARQRNMAVVFADTDEYPSFADLTADFVYARLMRSQAEEPVGYPQARLDEWAQRAREWAGGGAPADLPYVADPAAAQQVAREVFLFVISGAKARAPFAAMALQERCG
ncbi:DUF72 domain-containing protein [Niveibacterium sp. SC-1]|uniref:DUF72 domain-containing protein n=1 Tax=Niveibacterium sp. SC-1 TaxID=3135646 RepID=UPI00311DB514